MECNLSGVPELFVFLSQPLGFTDYSVHESLLPRIDAYEREKVLNFIPPSGNTIIFYYNIKGAQVRIPFDFIPRLSITDVSWLH
jgi:AP-3 complex subunit mu